MHTLVASLFGPGRGGPRRPGVSRSVAGWGLALALIAVIAVAGHAQAAGPVAVRLSFRPVDPIGIGSGTTVTLDLRITGGPVVANEPVELSLDGAYYRRSRTDSSGSVSFPIPKDLVAGKHALSAYYPGRSNTYLTARATSSLEVDPFELAVQTVPALPGMAFTLDGTRFEAGADGYARIAVDAPGDHVLIALDQEYENGGTTAEFARWTVNNEYSRQVTFKIPYVGKVQAGFDVFRPASQEFIDPSGGLVQPDRITSFTLRSSLGQVLTYPNGRERVYKASRVVRRSTGLESVDVRYNVTDVEVDGSNVVNAGQQHFYSTPGAVWRISLLLYSAQIHAKDALFGFTSGQAVEVIFPSGKTETYEVPSSGEVVIPWLARGIYRVGVAHAAGIAPSMPVALSRDQQVELRVISYLDMGVVSVVGLVIVFGLLYRGRPHLLRDTARAVGDGLSGLWLRLPGTGRPASAPKGAANEAPLTGTSPPIAAPPAAASPPAAANAAAGAPQEPQVAQAGTEGRAKVAPILATIARRSDLDALDRAPVSYRRTLRDDTPVSPDLIELAPSLFGPQTAEPPTPPAKPPVPATPAASAEPATPAKPPPPTPPATGVPAREAAAGGPAPAAPPVASAGAAESGPATVPAPEEAEAPVPAKRSRAKGTQKRRATAKKTKAATKGGKSRRAPAKASLTATSDEGKPPRKPAASSERSTAKRATAKRAAPKRSTRTAAPKPAASASSASQAKAPTRKRASGTAAKPATAKRATAKRAAPKRSTRSASAGTKRTVRAKPAGTARSASTSSSGSPARPARRAATRRTSGTTRSRPARSRTSRSAPSEPLTAAASPEATAAQTDQPTETPVDAAEMQACRNCGLELWVGAQYCRRCGQPTGETGTDEAGAAETSVGESAPTPAARSPRTSSRRRSSAKDADAARAGTAKRDAG